MYRRGCHNHAPTVLASTPGPQHPPTSPPRRRRKAGSRKAGRRRSPPRRRQAAPTAIEQRRHRRAGQVRTTAPPQTSPPWSPPERRPPGQPQTVFHSHYPCTRRTRPLAPGLLTQPTTALKSLPRDRTGSAQPRQTPTPRARFPLSMPKPAHQAPAQLTVRFARPPSPGGGRAALCSDTPCGPLVGRRPTRLSAAQAAAHHQPPPQPSIPLERPAEPRRAPAWHRRERPQPAPDAPSPQLEARKRAERPLPAAQPASPTAVPGTRPVSRIGHSLRDRDPSTRASSRVHSRR